MSDTTTVELRIYDDRSDVPQPMGPVGVQVPAGADEAEIAEVIARGWADLSRPFAIEYRDGPINGPGWRLIYHDEASS